MTENPQQKQARYAREDAAPGMAEKRARREAAIGAAAEKVIASLGIPERVLSAALAPKRTEAIVTVTDFTGDMLVMSGNVGCGKSVAAAWWLVERVRSAEAWRRTRTVDPNGHVVDYSFAPRSSTLAVWTTAARLARANHYEEGFVERHLTALFLVIDDMGAEYMDEKGFYLSLLDEIVNERSGNHRPTVMTTNIDVSGFRERYRGRIADRLREAGRFRTVGTESLRQRQQ